MSCHFVEMGQLIGENAGLRMICFPQIHGLLIISSRYHANSPRGFYPGKLVSTKRLAIEKGQVSQQSVLFLDEFHNPSFPNNVDCSSTCFIFPCSTLETTPLLPWHNRPCPPFSSSNKDNVPNQPNPTAQIPSITPSPQPICALLTLWEHHHSRPSIEFRIPTPLAQRRQQCIYHHHSQQ